MCFDVSVRYFPFLIKVVTLVLIVGCHLFNDVSAQSDVPLGREFVIQSEILGEDRHYVVHLPTSYEGDDLYVNKRYPVLVILDADTHFLPICGLTHALSVNDEVIPEMIIVGVRNTDRSRDMMPTPANNKTNGSQFSRFLETELLKEIDKRYRTLSFRILIGHSLAGLFALDCFLNKSAFNAYLAIDPSVRWGNEFIVKKADSVCARNPNTKSILYTAESKNPFDTSAVDKRHSAFEQFRMTLDKAKAHGLIHTHEYFKNEDHFSIPSIAFHQGLLHVFEGFKIPLHSPALKSTLDVIEYCRLYQQRMGAEICVPGKLINQVAAYHLSKNMPDSAIELFKVNETFFPNSFLVYKNLAEAYRLKGNMELSAKYYKMALKLSPDNQQLKEDAKKITP